MNNEYRWLSKKIDINELIACEAGYMDNEDCSWYHKNWMLLRQLGLVSNPFWHEQFFMEQIRNCCNLSNCKVLVLGTADFSMPYLCAKAGIERLYISDICLTPLNICDLIAANEGFKWNTFLCDVRDGLPDQYDVIVGDAFLTRFEYLEKAKVLKNIGQALNPNGKYITTIRQGWNNGKPLIPSMEEKKKFVLKSINAAIDYGEDISVAEIAARQYIDRMLSYPIPDRKALSKICEDIFSINYLASLDVPGECVASTYFEVVLSKG